MAKAKEPRPQDALDYFKEVMRRAQLHDYYCVNQKIISKTPKGASVVIIPDQALFELITADEELKSHMKELDPGDTEQQLMINTIEYAGDMNDGVWVPIDAETLFKGKMVHINVDNKFDYEVSIHKSLLPIKMKKNEFTDFSYQIKIEPLRLIVRKYFVGCLPDYGFNFIRVYQIL